MKQSLVLGISGRIGAGKDTLADSLAKLAPSLMPDYRPLKVGLADPIRQMMTTYFGVGGGKMRTQAEKAQPLACNPSLTVRDGLKRLGRTFCDIDPDCFCRLLYHTVDHYSAGGSRLVLVPDVRRVREVEYIQRRGGRVLRLTRVDRAHFEKDGIDAELDSYGGFDGVVMNGPLLPAQTAAEAIMFLASWGWISADLLGLLDGCSVDTAAALG